MNAADLAERLDGREIGNEITKTECMLADESNLLVVFGASDDLIEFRGLIEDEGSCYEGGGFKVDDGGIREEWVHGEKSYEDAKDYFQREKAPCIDIEAMWCHGDEGSWSYEVYGAEAFPFRIYEYGELYCTGVVIDASSLKG